MLEYSTLELFHTELARLTVHPPYCYLYVYRTQFGCMPIHCAAKGGHKDVVSLFLEKGADVVAATKVSVQSTI
jgi:hypothetical protein